MSIYRIHFSWKSKDYTLKAESLDLSHPYFVSIKGLLLPKNSGILVNIADNELRDLFCNTGHLLIPFGSVSLIEELDRDPDSTGSTTKGLVLMKRGAEDNDE